MAEAVVLALKEKCTGCGACKEICPKGAISFDPDEEGFPSPVIDQDVCVHCRQCENVCPALHKPGMYPIKTAYAAQLNDQESLLNSTSGGVFTALSRWVFDRHGIVYGCVWDDQYNAVLCKAEKEDQIIPMRGSKYVWSWAGDTFPEIKRYLESGKIVLFTGMPCQIAGLKNYLHNNYESLYTAGFLCGGSPSPLALREYLKIIREVPADKLNLKFRDKEKYGVGVHITYNTRKGAVCQTYIQNSYYFAFNTKVINRRSCYDCPYRYEDRIEDLTFCDYWGIEKVHSEFDNRKGVSGILVNTKKGAMLLEQIRGQFKLVATRKDELARANNLSLGKERKVYQMPSFRDVFFKTLKEDGWKKAEKKYLYNMTRLKLWLKQFLPEKQRVRIRRILRRIR